MPRLMHKYHLPFRKPGYTMKDYGNLLYCKTTKSTHYRMFASITIIIDQNCSRYVQGKIVDAITSHHLKYNNHYSINVCP